MKYKILIDNVDYTKNVALPFTEQYVLDQSLDNGVLNIKGIKREEIFKPFTIVEIIKNEDSYKYFVAQDLVVEIVGTDFYNHDLTLIEETKILEKKVVDTNTTTQPREHNFVEGSGYAYITKVEGLETSYYYSDMLMNILRPNTHFPSVCDFMDKRYFDDNRFQYGIKIYNVDGEYVCGNDNGVLTNAIGGIETDLIPTQELEEGQYSIIYTYFANIIPAPLYELQSTNIAIVKEIKPKIKTITDVVNRLLAITETIRADETPKLKLNDEQAEYYKDIIAPEFAITKSTLRECLDQIGAYIHSIVRLKGNEIYFDKLGGNTETEIPLKYSGFMQTQNCEQYASQLDSVVDNLVNIDDEQQGTIVEPFAKGYETLRADGTIRIGDGESSSVCIETEYPIEKIKKLLIGFIDVRGQIFENIDITSYVYENAEYQALSSYLSTFPMSKAYAIYYTQDQKNINGLMFKLPNAISPIFENQAILNIISQAIGQKVQDLFNVQNIVRLNYQLEYYPSTTARVKQRKTYLGDFDKEITSIYNQGANKVDSRFYGENLKGAIARLGNVEKTITENVSNENQLKNVGELIGDCYISKVEIENMPDQIKVSYGLSKDFNALNKYIGIMNNIRMYEVSERQIVERFVNYDDYCVIGEEIESDNKELITNKAIDNMILQFNGETNTSNSISVARLQGFDEYNNPLNSVDLPVFSLGLGNSIWLGCKYADNYSAGNQSQEATSSTSDYYRVQNYVRYTDYYGELETLKVQMFDYLTPITDMETAIDVGNKLPLSTLEASQQSLIDTTNNNLVIKKDNRETIHLGYQLHFITNDKNIIIGSQLGQGSPLVSNFETSSASLYILKSKLTKFEKEIDLSDAILVKNYNGDTSSIVVNDRKIIFANETANANGESWVLIDNATNTLLFGKNIAIIENEEIEMPKMSFTHKIIGE